MTESAVGFESDVTVKSIETRIFEALKDRLEGLKWLKSVEFDNIKLFSTDWQEHEVPAVQFYDAGQSNIHQRGVLEVDWSITLELIMKPKVTGRIDQRDLLDKKYAIERRLGTKLQLGIQGLQGIGSMVHITYPSAITDIHILDPFHVAIMSFVIKFRKPFSSDCL